MTPSLSQLMQRFLTRPDFGHAESDFLPYDVATAFQVDPNEAWRETILTLSYFDQAGSPPEMPSEWPEYVHQQPPATFLPMSPGNYPQQVRDLSLLLKSPPDPRRNVSATFRIPYVTAPACHETAMDHWQAGSLDEAIKAWETLPDTALKSFNLGISHLKNENRSAAINHLKKASRLLPEGSGWQELADFYLTWADLRDRS